MSISLITGKPGGGKGLLSVQQLVDEIRLGKRCVITNLPVRMHPWVNGHFDPMIGLKAYLLKTYGQDFDCEKRVFILDDDDAGAFYLWRVVEGKLTKAQCSVRTVNKDGISEERVMDFETDLAVKAGGVLYIIDEAWKFYSARNWQRTGEGMLFYSAQHRHFGDDVLIVTQHTKQIDPAVYRVAQDFWVTKNHSKMSIGIFRQPDVFTVAIYDQAPTGAALEPMSRKVFRLDKRGLAQCYDTSAGIGITGRAMADIGARRKGLPWWGIFVLAGVLAIAAWLALKGGLWGLRKGTAAVVGGGAVHASATVQAKSVSVASQAPAVEKQSETNRVYCVGYILWPDMRAYMSDGRELHVEDGLSECTPRRVRIGAEWFDVKMAKIPPYVPSQLARSIEMQPEKQGLAPLPVASQLGSSGVDVVTIGESAQHLAPSSTGGFASMGRQKK